MKKLILITLFPFLAHANHDCEIDPIKMLHRKIEYTQERIDEFMLSGNENDERVYFYLGKKAAYEDCLDLLSYSRGIPR